MTMKQTSIKYMEDTLGEYLDFDFLDELSPPKRKHDGNYYGTYVAEILPEYATLAPEHKTVVLKEISTRQVEIYQALSTCWNPYLETVFGVVHTEYSAIAINEFIEKPSYLFYPTKELSEKRTLSLEDYILNFGCLSETEAIIFLIQLCQGLEQFSKLHTVHGDVAPQNILLTDRFFSYPDSFSKIPGLHQKVSMKLIDFDIARKEKEPEHPVTTVEGTNPFAAPEILDYKTPTDRVDIYSLGCILSFMLTGKSPKQAKKSELDRQYSSSIKKIIGKCTADYYRRYKNIHELQQELSYILTGFPFSIPGIVHSIPGFRSGNLFKMCIASLAYVQFLLLFLMIGLDRSTDSQPLFLCLILMLILTFDVFHLGGLSNHYLYYREKYPWLRYLIKLILGIVFPFVLLVLLVQ